MRSLLSLLFLLTFTVALDACIVGPCRTWRPPTDRTRTRRPTTTTSPHTHHPETRRCTKHEDCRYPMMETEVPFCDQDGYCHNYDMIKDPRPRY